MYLVHDKKEKCFHVGILHWSAVRDAIEETKHYLEPDFHGLVHYSFSLCSDSVGLIAYSDEHSTSVFFPTTQFYESHSVIVRCVA